MNTATTNALRGQLTDKYVGYAGIHGIGVQLHNDRPVVYVYAERQPQPAVVKELQDEASPYEVVVVTEEMPKATTRGHRFAHR